MFTDLIYFIFILIQQLLSSHSDTSTEVMVTRDHVKRSVILSKIVDSSGFEPCRKHFGHCKYTTCCFWTFQRGILIGGVVSSTQVR